MSDFLEEMNRKQAALDARDLEAKKSGKLIGRYIQHPYADSYAVYEIIDVTATKAHIRVVDIGDAWVLPAWGRETKIALSKAKSMLQQRDALLDMFKNHDDWWASQDLAPLCIIQTGIINTSGVSL